MHTWKIYDYSRTKMAAVLIYSFYFRSCATTSPMRIAIIHSVPPAFSLNFQIINLFKTEMHCYCNRTTLKKQPCFTIFYIKFYI